MVAAAFVLDVSCSLCMHQMQQGTASNSAEASGRASDSSLSLYSAATPLLRWARKREPWQRGLVFLNCQFFTWKIKLQTQLSYSSEVTQPLIQGSLSASPGHRLPRDVSVREVCDTGDRLCDV